MDIPFVHLFRGSGIIKGSENHKMEKKEFKMFLMKEKSQ